MLKLCTLTAVLVALPHSALAQDMSWHVLVARPGVAMMVSVAEGPPEERELTLLTILPQPSQGMDNEFTLWTVNCAARTVENGGGTGFLGAVKVGNTGAQTQGPQPATAPMHVMIADYACSGKRVSADSRTLATDADAVAYGKTLAAK